MFRLKTLRLGLQRVGIGLAAGSLALGACVVNSNGELGNTGGAGGSATGTTATVAAGGTSTMSSTSSTGGTCQGCQTVGCQKRECLPDSCIETVIPLGGDCSLNGNTGTCDTGEICATGLGRVIHVVAESDRTNSIEAVAFAANGDLIFAGESCDGNPRSCRIYIRQQDPILGTERWSTDLDSDVLVTDLAVAPNGDIAVSLYITDDWQGRSDLALIPSQGSGQPDGVMLWLDANGTVTSVVPHSTPAPDEIRSIAIDDNGLLLSSGFNEAENSKLNTFLSKGMVDRSATMDNWYNYTDDNGDEMIYSVAAQGSRVAYGGFYNDDWALLGETKIATAGDFDGVYGIADNTTGATLQVRHLSATNRQIVRTVRFRPDGSLVVTGDFTGTVDFGGFAATSTGGPGILDTFVLAADAQLKTQWVAVTKSISDSEVRGLAADGNNNTIVAGLKNGAIEIGGAPHAHISGTGTFVAKYGPDGTPLWSHATNNTDDQTVRDIAVDPVTGLIAIAGRFKGVVSLSGKGATGAANLRGTGFVAILDP